MIFSELESADLRLNQPIVRVVVCCARTECGIATTPVRPVRNSRRLMFAPGSGANIVLVETGALIGAHGGLCCPNFADVRFGSEADICVSTRYVRFTQNSDRKADCRKRSC